MADKPKTNVIRSIFELLVLLLGLGVIFGGLAVMIFLSPWSKTILDKLLDYDIRFVIELLVFLTIGAIAILLSVLMVLVKNIVHSALYLLWAWLRSWFTLAQWEFCSSSL